MSNFKRKPLIINPNADTMPRVEKPYTYAMLSNDRTITLSDDVAEMALLTTTSDIINLAVGSRLPKACVFTDDHLPLAENAYTFLNEYGEKTGSAEEGTVMFYAFNGCEYVVLADNSVMTINEYNSIADADADADADHQDEESETMNAPTPQIPSLLKKVQTMLFDGLNELDEPAICDIHHHIYNTDYAYYYTADAKKALAELDVWQGIATVKAYEQSAFGECSIDLTDPVKVANMLTYIVGEALLHKIFGNTQYFNKHWDSYADAEMLADMRDWALQYIDEEPNVMLDIWRECVEQY